MNKDIQTKVVSTEQQVTTISDFELSIRPCEALCYYLTKTNENPQNNQEPNMAPCCNWYEQCEHRCAQDPKAKYIFATKLQGQESTRQLCHNVAIEE